jgi:hypothetical protein
MGKTTVTYHRSNTIMTEFVDSDTGEIVQASPTAIEQIEKSQLEVQMTQARKFPRTIKKFEQKATMLATHNAEIAKSCFYCLKRGGKFIEGPSVRLAEIMASSWGNMKAGARIISEDASTVTAQGVAVDLENNLAMSVEVTRRITDKYGKRFSDDMVIVTKNAACAIAYRNAVLKAIPAAFAAGVMQKAQKVALGEGKPLNERVDKALRVFREFGVGASRVLTAIERSSASEVTEEDLKALLGFYNAIKDGDSTADEVFAYESLEEKTASAEAKMSGGNGKKTKEPDSKAKAEKPKVGTDGKEETKQG